MSSAATELTVLVAGAGSIGTRHLNNLRALGVRRLGAFDPDPVRRAAVEAGAGVETYADYGSALDRFRPDAVAVCSPPVFHLSQARAAVGAGAHVFVEKPPSHDLDGVDDLMDAVEARGVVAQVGYNLRFHPGMTILRSLLDDGVIGRIRLATVEYGQFLPDWRPGTDYRTGYSARRALGGGILLDGSHELDYALMLMGRPTSVTASLARVGGLEMDAEDTATLVLRFDGGALATVHVDCVQRAYSRGCKLVGEDGTLEWDWPNNRVRHFGADTGVWRDRTYRFDANEMYLAEMESFLDCIASDRRPEAGLEQGREVLRVVRAARTSSCEGRTVRLTPRVSAGVS